MTKQRIYILNSIDSYTETYNWFRGKRKIYLLEYSVIRKGRR